MPTTITKDIALKIVQGAGFLASGGGGSIQLSKQLASEAFERSTATLMALGELTANKWIGVAAEIGSPEKLLAANKVRTRSATNALTTLQRAAVDQAKLANPYFSGFTKFDAVSSVEIGALSTTLALIAAMDMGIVAVDTDGAGRAVPTLPLLTFAGRFPIVPNALAGDSAPGVSYNSVQQDVRDEATLETGTIGLLGSGMLGAVAGIAAWPATVARFSQPGSMPVLNSTIYSYELGGVILGTSGGNRVGQVLSYVNGKMARTAEVAYIGKVTEMVQATEGLDVGHVTVSGTGSFAGTNLRIYIQNENIFAQRDDQETPLIMSPDSISYLSLQGDVFDNSDLYTLVNAPDYEPVDVVVVAIAAAGPVIEREDLMSAWAHTRGMFGYYGPFARPWVSLSENNWKADLPS